MAQLPCQPACSCQQSTSGYNTTSQPGPQCNTDQIVQADPFPIMQLTPGSCICIVGNYYRYMEPIREDSSHGNLIGPFEIDGSLYPTGYIISGRCSEDRKSTTSELQSRGHLVCRLL